MENKIHNHREDINEPIIETEVSEERDDKRGFKINPSMFLPISILIAAALISGTILYTRSSGSGGNVADEKPVKIKLEAGDHVLGQEKAKVTIVEFSDFQCPFCRAFWQGALPQIRKDYIDTGKVKLVYKHLPLGIHSAAVPAAQASECAGEQNKFWQYHDKMYEEQSKQGNGTIAFGPKELTQWAKEIGLDMTAFGQCFSSNKYSKKVSGDTQLGSSLNVDGTPTFFVNGRRIVGAQPFSNFKELIEKEL